MKAPATASASLGAGFALLSAALFGLSAPVSKLLLVHVAPLPLAGLVYLGVGATLTCVRVARSARGGRGGRGVPREARLRRGDAWLVASVILCGGVVGPLLLFVGLQRLSGVAGALFLNLEAPFTMILAVLLFREYLGLRASAAAAVILGGAVVLAARGGGVSGDWLGAAAIAGACLAWAADNNLMQRLSLRDPIAVVHVKSLGAGTMLLLLALAFRLRLPAGPIIGAALALGAAMSLSIVFQVLALRLLGAARQAAYFATAPFIGALAAIPLLGERLTATDVVSGVLMAAGVALLLAERHGHFHVHDALEHDHVHVTDLHHRHSHEGLDVGPEPHAHPHRHEPVAHAHAHVSDVHHRHGHGKG